MLTFELEEDNKPQTRKKLFCGPINDYLLT